MNIIVILIGMINPLLSIPISIYNFLKQRSPFLCSVMLSTAMAYVAYFYQSRYVGDLERYMSLLALYKGIPLHACFDRVYSGLYALDIFFWICAKFTDERMLVVFTAFILYFCTFYVSLDYLNQFECIGDFHIVGVIILIFTLLPYYSFLSSIRSSLALSFGSLALYIEYVKGKKNLTAWALYILPILFHLAGSLVIFLRFALLIQGRKRYLIWATGGLILALMGTGLFNSVSYLNGVFTDLSDKIVEYSAYGSMKDSEWFISVRRSIITYLQKGLCAAVLAMVICNAKDERNSDENEWDESELDENEWDESELDENELAENNINAKKMSEVGVCLSSIMLGMLFFPTTFYLRYFTGLFPFLILSAYRYGEMKWSKRLIIWGSAAAMLIIQVKTLSDNTDVIIFAKHLILGILNLFFS